MLASEKEPLKGSTEDDEIKEPLNDLFEEDKIKQPLKDLIKENKIKILSIGVLIVAISSYIIFKEPSACNMKNIQNRNFKVYYGLNHVKKPFGALSAEQNINTPLFQQVITENMNAASIILTGEFGSGKTQIRNYRLSQYDKSSTLIIKLFGSKINKYLDVFVKNIKGDENSAQKLAKHFNKNEFMNIVLSEIVDNILNYGIKNYKKNLNKLNYDERLKIASLIAFYSRNEQPAGTLTLINELLFEKTGCWLCSKIDLLKCDREIFSNFKKRHVMKHEYLDFRELLDTVLINDEDQNDKAAHLLFCIMEKTQISSDFLKENSKYIQITILSKFLKEILNMKLVIAIDSLDENLYFFESKGKPYLDTLQTFVDSVINQELLALTLGNKENVLFDILIFLPKFDGIKINWDRRDKIPVIDLKWNSMMLKNYADFVLSHLRNSQSWWCCKVLPTFNELLQNDSELVDEAINSLRHPRDFHIFITFLIKVLNENSISSSTPFIASKAEIESALKQGYEQMFNRRND